MRKNAEQGIKRLRAKHGTWKCETLALNPHGGQLNTR